MVEQVRGRDLATLAPPPKTPNDTIEARWQRFVFVGLISGEWEEVETHSPSLFTTYRINTAGIIPQFQGTLPSSDQIESSWLIIWNTLLVKMAAGLQPTDMHKL